ncbi:hypothetical protein [Methylobacterium oryzisoli]|uniref:hypothetical protein n=1 Tax=Methylobacterium oryzisoli TaxID=3385502 RepID=UPI003891DDC4
MQRIVLAAAAAAAILAALPVDAQARGRRGGTGVFFVSTSVPVATAARAKAASEPRAAPESKPGGAEPPPIRTASAEPQPVTTGATPPPAPAARPWCAGGRVFGSGQGFCEIN